MLKISYADCLGLSPAISSQFTFEVCKAAKNRKITPNSQFFFLGGGGSLSSVKVIDVNTAKKLISACYDKQHVCGYLQLLISIK